MDPLKMCFLLKMGIFHGYVSLPEGNGCFKWMMKQIITYQMIQFVTFLSSVFGGEVYGGFAFEVGSRFHSLTHHPKKATRNCQVKDGLVGGFNPLEKYYIDENKKIFETTT